MDVYVTELTLVHQPHDQLTFMYLRSHSRSNALWYLSMVQSYGILNTRENVLTMHISQQRCDVDQQAIRLDAVIYVI